MRNPCAFFSGTALLTGLMSMMSMMSMMSLMSLSAFGHSDLRRVGRGFVSSDPSFCTYPDGTHPSAGGIHCYNPSEFMEAYGIDRLHRMGLTGKGQTIILLDSLGSPTMQADLDKFSDTFGLPRKAIHFIYPDGIYLNSLSMPDPKDPSRLVPDADKIGWAEETTLDLEWAHAIAPDAELVNVITSVSETAGVTGLPELFRGIEMAADRFPNGIVSMSFGTGEPTFTGDEAHDDLQGAFHGIFERATRAGMTLLAATGDNGTAGMALRGGAMMDIPSTDYPASDPFITSVGGTALQYGWRWDPEGTIADFMDCMSRRLQEFAVNPRATPIACPDDFMKSEPVVKGRVESVWKEDWALAAGGGGISAVFDLPDYQAAALPEELKRRLAGHRAIPDLAMNAAINGGVVTYTGFQVPGATQSPVWTSIGGTSAATPEAAALIALAGQRASQLVGRSVGIGFLNPLLYSLGSQDFHDIVPESFGTDNQVTLDNNGLYFSDLALQIFGPTKETPVQVPGYPVTTGYDLATGLGSPVAERFVEDLARARAALERRLP